MVQSLPKAAAALVMKTNGLKYTVGSFIILGASIIAKGSSKNVKQHGAM